ncbi:5'-AMP-activated protein kinase subunit gamma-2 isoform X2 [Cimex lectularius]|uniref:CBS domain-containing protein n=1 Tax=Cimex lectularius TaxID=79782 RepID=A0A8I6S643_CIMLE|nr:5'-AMP-activated protein kinase subunit gamma-2 isoform X2 [Cimex lectularius]
MDAGLPPAGRKVTFQTGPPDGPPRQRPRRNRFHVTPADPNLGVVPGQSVEMAGSDPYRNRYDTWGSHTAALRDQERRRIAGRGDAVYHTVTGAVSQNTRQHQVPSIFEVFRPRSKSDAATKKPTLIGSMKNAMQNSLKSQSSTSGEGETHSRGPVAKVIHLFRHRSQSAASAEEKRKARAAAIHQQQVAAHTAYLKVLNYPATGPETCDAMPPPIFLTPPPDEKQMKKCKSIQDLLKQIGKAVRSKSPSKGLLEVPVAFRGRSRSLDDGSRGSGPSSSDSSPPVVDTATAYKIYDQILNEGVLRRSSIEKRRLSLGTPGHRGSEPSLDPNHAAILFRDSRGLPVADPFLEKVNMSDLEEDESQIFVKFFKFHKCYGLIPTSAKLVVFDTQLLVKKAFFALVYNGVRAAPLWDSTEHKFVGMLTITDFIKILQMHYSSGTMTLDQMEEHKLDTWRTVLKDQIRDLISISPDASLYDAIKVLIHNHIHRLPIIDSQTGNVLYILTHKRILRFLFIYINDLPRPSFLNKTLGELRIGTFENVETAREDTTIIAALNKFVERRISALPIVEDGRLVDIFAKFDVINLAAEKTYDKLDVSLKQANEHRNEWFEGVHKCSMDDTLYSIIEKIVRAEVHRLVVTDDEDKVIGILSLSDLLQYLVLRPCGEEILSRPMTPISELAAIASEETILEGEEDAESSRESTPPLTPQLSQTWREVAVSGGE